MGRRPRSSIAELANSPLQPTQGRGRRGRDAADDATQVPAGRRATRSTLSTPVSGGGSGTSPGGGRRTRSSVKVKGSTETPSNAAKRKAGKAAADTPAPKRAMTKRGTPKKSVEPAAKVGRARTARPEDPGFPPIPGGLTVGRPKTDEPSVPLLSVIQQSPQTLGAILFFYPKSSTPGCTAQVRAFNASLAFLNSKGFSVFGISKDRFGPLEKFRLAQGLKYELLSDAQFSAAEFFGVKKEPASLVRSVWVVRKADGRVMGGRPATPRDSVEIALEVISGAWGMDIEVPDEEAGEEDEGQTSGEGGIKPKEESTVGRAEPETFRDEPGKPELDPIPDDGDTPMQEYEESEKKLEETNQHEPAESEKNSEQEAEEALVEPNALCASGETEDGLGRVSDHVASATDVPHVDGTDTLQGSPQDGDREGKATTEPAVNSEVNGDPVEGEQCGLGEGAKESEEIATQNGDGALVANGAVPTAGSISTPAADATDHGLVRSDSANTLGEPALPATDRRPKAAPSELPEGLETKGDTLMKTGMKHNDQDQDMAKEKIQGAKVDEAGLDVTSGK